ncbi:MAG: DnaB-like helicase C-terminal domain-containing protein [Anaerolineae bacterium]
MGASIVREKVSLQQHEPVVPISLAQVMVGIEEQAARGEGGRIVPLPTGFLPLDDVMNGGIRPGELAIIAGAFGVGKTIMALQVARNVVAIDSDCVVLYVCYEHDNLHLLSRLLCLESALQGFGNNALTLRKVAEYSAGIANGIGLISQLKSIPRYAPLVEKIESYADRLFLVKASGQHTDLNQIREWVQQIWEAGPSRVLLAVDYLQKIPLISVTVDSEDEATTILAQGLKELAMATGSQVIAIAAADRSGLKSKRMRLSDLRGSSAIQYEADIGLVLNNKYTIVSREHMVYNPSQADAMRNFVVLTIEKNRAGANAIDMEFQLDAAHFRINPMGDFVQDRLIDDKVVLA